MSADMNPDDTVWVDVIRKMDETYAELVRYQVELEAKNSALEDAQQFIRSVLASTADVLVVCDREGRILQVNRALEQLTGKSESSLAGRPVYELFVEPAQALQQRFEVAIHDSGVHDCELNISGQGGESVPVAINCTPRYDNRHRILGLVLVGRPVGELRRAYEALNPRPQPAQAYPATTGTRGENGLARPSGGRCGARAEQSDQLCLRQHPRPAALL